MFQYISTWEFPLYLEGYFPEGSFVWLTFCYSALPYSLRDPYRDLKSEKSQGYAQKPQQNCMFMNLASVYIHRCHPTVSVINYFLPAPLIH